MDDIARLEAGQMALSKDVRELTASISELVAMQKVMQIEAKYLKESQAEIKQHIAYSKPILAKSATWQANVNVWFVRVVATVLASSIALFSYNSSQPSKVEMRLSKTDEQSMAVPAYSSLESKCDPRLEKCPRPTRTAMREV